MATLESCRERANRADEGSQSSLYYPRRMGEFRAKQSGRNLAVDPRRKEVFYRMIVKDLRR